jgi:hypothetical protein
VASASLRDGARRRAGELAQIVDALVEKKLAGEALRAARDGMGPRTCGGNSSQSGAVDRLTWRIRLDSASSFPRAWISEDGLRVNCAATRSRSTPWSRNAQTWAIPPTVVARPEDGLEEIVVIGIVYRRDRAARERDGPAR